MKRTLGLLTIAVASFSTLAIAGHYQYRYGVQHTPTGSYYGYSTPLTGAHVHPGGHLHHGRYYPYPHLHVPGYGQPRFYQPGYGYQGTYRRPRELYTPTRINPGASFRLQLGLPPSTPLRIRRP